MKQADVIEGAVYAVKVGDRIAPVELGRRYPYTARGWYGTNLRTGREVVIRSAARLRYRLELCDECPSRPRRWHGDLAAHKRAKHGPVCEVCGERIMRDGAYLHEHAAPALAGQLEIGGQ